MNNFLGLRRQSVGVENVSVIFNVVRVYVDSWIAFTHGHFVIFEATFSTVFFLFQTTFLSS